MRALLPSLALMLLPLPALADEAGDFDYYVLSLSWSPTWCELDGTPGEGQCDRDADFGWMLHGLWPQFEEGWPEDCATPERDPSRRETAAMADVMGSGGLAWHEWLTHGTCSGLPPEDYFALAREAYGAVKVPAGFDDLVRPVEVPAAAVERAFLRANPALSPEGITVTCRNGMIQELRICLTRDLEPRECGADARRDCRLEDALLLPIP